MKNNENSFKTNLFLSLKLSNLLPSSRGITSLLGYSDSYSNYVISSTASFVIATNRYLEGFQKNPLSLIMDI